MTQTDKATLFAGLHVKGDPVILYNIWDTGSAAVIADAGAKAVATGSWSVAAAQGYPDGEQIPLDVVLEIAARIAGAVGVPMTLDFEGGYAEDARTLTKNITRVIGTGAIGVNFEDQKVGGTGLFDVDTQHGRIQAMRGAADACEVPLFINARTDLFLKQPAADKHGGLLEEAIMRAASYEKAGASGFFAPGLVDAKLIADLCAAVSLPVNIMKKAGTPPLHDLAALGVARISYGPGSYFTAMADLAKAYHNIS